MFGFLKTGIQTIKTALKKTHSFLGKKLKSLFLKELNEETLEELEQVLYEADLGSETVNDFIAHIKAFHQAHPKSTSNDYLKVMQSRAESLLLQPSKIEGTTPSTGKPKVILILGVNGSGKTTSIAKLANLYKQKGLKVLLAAGDTFRAGAIEQLAHWANKIGVDLVKAVTGQDPSSVLYDAMQKGEAKEYDVVLCDTAGRLESKTDLMHELAKIKRTAQKLDLSAPHEVYLVIDSTLGQTAIEQARIFDEYVPITGIILSKIDGSAKGGVALALYRDRKIPIRYVAFGESIEDIAPFDVKSYTEALFCD